MKLYVWNEPYSRGYAGGICLALAGNEEQARELILADPDRLLLGEEPDLRGPADFVGVAPESYCYNWSE